MRFWKKKHVDERVQNIQNKIYKEIYFGIMLLASLSIVIKFITIGMSFQVVLTEWLIILFSSIYYTTRSVYLGIYSDEVELHDSRSKVKLGTKNLIVGIGLGLVLAISFATNSAINYADNTQEAVNFFFLVFGVSLFIYVPIFAGVTGLSYLVAKKKSEQINQNQLDDHEGKW
ncbi:DUF6773 family protein [Halalkalibacter akibai]|uniref:DUF3278 domain-containing protein n=1 Tax=Halalkalibacter akibai (strain ATCC 43226 / DSM 21942 / CIP 109018 / JCM 9157 / 1139) TaxID=1236973 RepID=W4QQ54_HALA3|nr:DUF6773 family protein [Halalkalibacter akibai]GAE34042.1 hypothetical protein JCM9157_1073 [Halalkalibacter akibai JCM 9157]